MSKKKIFTIFGTITCSDTNIRWNSNKKLKIKTNAIDLQFSEDQIYKIVDVE